MSNFLIELKNNSKKIEKWYSTLIEDEESDVVTSSPLYVKGNGLRTKIIKNPAFLRNDLLTLDFFNHDKIRTIVSIKLYPKTRVLSHNHENISYMVCENEQNYRIYPAEKDYKTTHFTIQTNSDSYLLYGDKKVFWKKNVFDELDLLHTYHSGINNGETDVKFLYIDYYE
jgi:hypothetical protein